MHSQKWMTIQIFKKWLIKLSADLQKWKTILFCIVSQNRGWIKLPQQSQFLPPNTTSKIRSLNRAMIQFDWTYYWKQIIKNSFSFLIKAQTWNRSLEFLIKLVFWLHFISEKIIQDYIRRERFVKSKDKSLNSYTLDNERIIKTLKIFVMRILDCCSFQNLISWSLSKYMRTKRWNLKMLWWYWRKEGKKENYKKLNLHHHTLLFNVNALFQGSRL